jgi:hypothetical protein
MPLLLALVVMTLLYGALLLYRLGLAEREEELAARMAGD